MPATALRRICHLPAASWVATSRKTANAGNGIKTLNGGLAHAVSLFVGKQLMPATALRRVRWYCRSRSSVIVGKQLMPATALRPPSRSPAASKNFSRKTANAGNGIKTYYLT